MLGSALRGVRVATVALVRLGRLAEARAMAGGFLRASPAFRIMRRSYMPHFRDRGFVAGYVDALLRAGVPGDHDGPEAAPPRKATG